MHWSLILLMVFTGFLIVTSAALLVMWIFLRAGRVPGDMFEALDASSLERTSKRLLWSIPGLVLMAVAGLALVIFFNTLVWILAGVLVLSLCLGWSTTLLVIIETARFTKGKVST